MLLQLALCFAIALEVAYAGLAEKPICEYNLEGSTGEFKTPNYPLAYPDNLNCSWTILSPGKSELIFQTFEIEESYVGEKCQFDVVYVYLETENGVQTHGPLCGYSPPGPFHYKDKAVVTLTSDRIRAYSGFLAYFRPEGGSYVPPPTEAGETEVQPAVTGEPVTPESPEEKPRCGYDTAEPRGTITSPNYPNNYENNLGCSWTIEKPAEPSILTFESFNVEWANWGGQCQFDYLYVFVGTGNHVKSYGPYCGNEKPDPIEFSEPVQITFTTDGSETRTGFSLKFQPQ
ncbi:Tolloid-like protein 2 [Clonorchis sinensis]|uniref:Tolloid-like protein 2 n=1 Tax=Clonorchis sinensis TaxID=79923 RepID=A0A8T1MC74_CLOSI|nr:Tolloid-like protein 2 [Clonorchis sinensis]